MKTERKGKMMSYERANQVEGMTMGLTLVKNEQLGRREELSGKRSMG